ncbi:hypothetical protein D3C84_1063410 [compost metagenome]
MVRLAAAAVETMAKRFFSSTRRVTVMATGEALRPAIRSTLRRSIHSRAVLVPRSALFLWSALNSTIFLSPTLPSKSSTAMRMASRPPGPARSL